MIHCEGSDLEITDNVIEDLENFKNYERYIYCNGDLNPNFLAFFSKNEDSDQDNYEEDMKRLNMYEHIINMVPVEHLITKHNEQFLKLLVKSLVDIKNFKFMNVYAESFENSRRAETLLKKLVKKIENKVRYKLNIDTDRIYRYYTRLSKA
jgi:GTPase Era involved in 16S rRNA processing